ncbi:hypothetical protein SAMN05216417_10630 [Nitrosospira multiformis]|uniref:Uncharacterized protein n=1 Tax=Nitrosospira multiformis TaxID=1231 RepID=A0A1I7GWB1_9PROT|nr:hypothetical protein SAMN05216417_10630 [Nitrosospira multiformis]
MGFEGRYLFSIWNGNRSDRVHDEAATRRVCRRRMSLKELALIPVLKKTVAVGDV